MANVPYEGGVPGVSPAATPPSDYLNDNVRANPEQTGGLISQGLEKAGAGVSNATKFFSQVQTDGAMNGAFGEGDQVVQHFRTLRGQDALDAQDGVNKALDDIGAKYHDALSTPEQQLAFDNAFRPCRLRYWASPIAAHADEQGYACATQTTKDSFEHALSVAANGATMDDLAVGGATLAVARAKAQDSQYKQLQIDGQEGNPEAVEQARQRADAAVFKTAAEAMAARPGGATRAMDFIEQHKTELGTAYPEVYGRIKAQASDEKVQAGAKASADGALSATFSPTVNGLPPADPGARPGYSYEGAASGHESGGSLTVRNPTTGATGLYQFTPATWADMRAQHPDLNLPATTAEATGSQQTAAFQAFTAANRKVLQDNGVAPTDKNTFMASFLGANGAVRFFNGARSNPTAQAAQYFPAEARANPTVFYDPTGAPRTYGQIYALMTKNFSGAVSVPNTVAGFGLSGPTQVASSTQPEAAAAAGETATEQPAQPAVEPATYSPEVAAPKPPAAPVPEQTPEDKLAQLEDARAHAIADMIRLHPDWNDAELDKGSRLISAQFAMYASAVNEDKRQREARKQALANDVDGALLAGDPMKAFSIVESREDVDNETKYKTIDFIEKASGQFSPKSLGTKYTDYLDRVLKEGGDPERIGVGDADQLYKAVRSGDLTPGGASQLLGVVRDVQKTGDEYGLQERVKTSLERVRDKLVKADPLTGLRDPKGMDKFNDFEDAFFYRFNRFRNSGKSMGDFPLFNTKDSDELVEKIYPKKERDLDATMAAVDATNGGPLAAPSPAAPPPGAPPGVDAAGWKKMVAAPPPGFTQVAWGAALHLLAVEPKNAAAFNASKFGQAGYRAEDILRAFHPAAPRAPTPEEEAERIRTTDLGGALRQIGAALARTQATPGEMTPEERRRRYGVE
jgi:hypothetical protein